MYRMILFDVDGVFLSEEGCFDVSALSVLELLYSERFLGLPGGWEASPLSDEQGRMARNEVFCRDRVLDWMKKRGVNSNWDMVFLAFSAQLFRLLDRLFAGREAEVRRFLTEPVTESSLKEIREWGGEAFSAFRPDFSSFFSVMDGTESMDRDALLVWFNRLAEQRFGIRTEQFFGKGPLWELGRSVFQEWYLGEEHYREVERREPRVPGKEGFLHREKPLADPDRLRELLLGLRNRGIRLGIGTGRTEPETRIPLESLGLWDLFDTEHVATATDVLAAEEAFPERAPLGKPDPFTYVRAHAGRVAGIRECLDRPLPLPDGDRVLIVGDSVADHLAARKMGCRFVATLTGLTGEEARPIFERMGADGIIRDVTELEGLIG